MQEVDRLDRVQSIIGQPLGHVLGVLGIAKDSRDSRAGLEDLCLLLNWRPVGPRQLGGLHVRQDLRQQSPRGVEALLQARVNVLSVWACLRANADLQTTRDIAQQIERLALDEDLLLEIGGRIL